MRNFTKFIFTTIILAQLVMPVGAVASIETSRNGLGHGSLIASGAVGSLATTSVGNMYAASTGAGRVGKYKLFGVGDDSVNWGINTKKIAGHKKRDHVYRMAKELNENELKLVAKDKDLINGILENPYSLNDEEIVLLARHKIKPTNMTPKDVIRVAKDKDGDVVFLENGKVNPHGGMTGWIHLTKEIRAGDTSTRYQQFKDAGLINNKKEFKDLLFDIVKTSDKIPVLPSGFGYVKSINGKKPKVIVSSNGFIVTAIPNSN